jgi:hypothetical protein
MASLNVLFVILAVRAVLMLATIGAIILSVMVVRAPDPWRLGALAIYAIAIVLPLIGLSSRK